MSVNINDVGILKGLRDAVIALNKFDGMVKADANALRERDASLTDVDATNMVLMDKELQQMLSVISPCISSYGKPGCARGSK